MGRSKVVCNLQWQLGGSSDPSPQSLSPSQCHLLGIHRSLLQRNWLLEQVALDTGVGAERQSTCFTAGAALVASLNIIKITRTRNSHDVAINHVNLTASYVLYRPLKDDFCLQISSPDRIHCLGRANHTLGSPRKMAPKQQHAPTLSLSLSLPSPPSPPSLPPSLPQTYTHARTHARTHTHTHTKHTHTKHFRRLLASILNVGWVPSIPFQMYSWCFPLWFWHSLKAWHICPKLVFRWRDRNKTKFMGRGYLLAQNKQTNKLAKTYKECIHVRQNHRGSHHQNHTPIAWEYIGGCRMWIVMTNR